jgi:DNA-directed RNA polymerase subunit RPC12/RpoP
MADYITCPKCREVILLDKKDFGLKCDFCGKENVKKFYFSFETKGDNRIKCEECKSKK